MEAATLRALQAKAVLLPGGRDREERPLVIIPVPQELQPMAKENLNTALKYLLSVFRYPDISTLSLRELTFKHYSYQH